MEGSFSCCVRSRNTSRMLCVIGILFWILCGCCLALGVYSGLAVTNSWPEDPRCEGFYKFDTTCGCCVEDTEGRNTYDAFYPVLIQTIIVGPILFTFASISCIVCGCFRYHTKKHAIICSK